MNTILLKNTTGKRYGRYIRYEFGEDLFGYIFLDVYSGKKHRAKKLRSHLFANARDFLRTLDTDIGKKEDLDFIQEKSFL